MTARDLSIQDREGWLSHNDQERQEQRFAEGESTNDSGPVPIGRVLIGYLFLLASVVGLTIWSLK